MCRLKESLLETFLKEFTLSEDQIETLTGSYHPLDMDFFQALSHLQKVNQDTRNLLMAEDHVAVSDIMQVVKECNEVAFDRLYNWTKNQVGSMRADSPEIPRELRAAMVALKSRPVLYQSIVDEITVIRKTLLTKTFNDALTRGGPGGFPRPIEMHAHDPLRYVGDMLAWTHQTLASEREILVTLLESKPNDRLGNDQVKKVEQDMNIFLKDIPGFLEPVSVIGMLEKVMDGIARPLKTRIEQVLVSEQSPITLFRITNMIQFYGETMLKMIEAQTVMQGIFDELSASAFRLFFEILNQHATQLVASVEPPSRDLLPPPLFQDALSQLKEILMSQESSLAASATKDTSSEFKTIVTTVLDPLKQSCNLIASHAVDLLESAIFTVNCLHAIQMTLNLFSFTIEQIHDLDSLIDCQIDILVLEQHNSILKQSGLASLIRSIDENKKAKVILAKDMKTHPGVVREAMSHLDTFLASPSSSLVPSLSRLTSSKVIQKVCQRGLARFLETYRKLYEDIKDPVHEYGNMTQLRTVEQMETLLSV